MQDLKELNEVITAIKEEIRQGADALTTSKSVYEFKKTFLDNKQGRIGLLMKEMRNVANDQKAEFGKTINGAKEWANNFFDELDQKLKEKEQQQRYESEKIDITMPPVKIRYGNLHPVTTVRNQLTDIFTSMGFEVYEGTEIETDYYNFTALNTPQDHPARDMQDTFYLSPEFLLRTQTSAGQVHVMEAKKPPIKVVSPGKVFRSDDDATHSPMFSQMEGLVVDEGITLCDLKGMLDMFVQRIFGEHYEMGLDPRRDTKLHTVCIGAEPHSEEQRRRIEQLLGVKAYNCFGMSEMNGPGVAFECTEQNGLHIWEDNVIVEIIDPVTLQPVKEGEVGEMVLTTINREAMPLLRYRTRDLTCVLPGECPCGRTHKRLARFKGRSDDMIILKGVNLFPIQIEKILMQFKELGSNYLITIETVGNNDEMLIEVELC